MNQRPDHGLYAQMALKEGRSWYPMLEGSSCTLGLLVDSLYQVTRLTVAALNPSFPFNSASFSYPTGASSLYGLLMVYLTFEVSWVGWVIVSVAEGAISFDLADFLYCTIFTEC